MNNLLLFMTFSGSLALCTYYGLKFIFKERLTPTCRYTLLKLTLGFYLLPIPLLSNDAKQYVRLLLRDESLFGAEIVPHKAYRKNLEKIIYLSDSGIYLPRYRPCILLFFSIWVLVALTFLVYYLCQYHALKKQLKGCTENPLYENNFLTPNEQNLIRRRHIQFRMSSDHASAFTFGLLHPVIFLPAPSQPQESYYIVRHELMHIKSFDFFFRFLALCAVAIHFYNPLVYLLFVEINLAAELHCDEITLKDAPPEERKRYGHLVISNASLTPNCQLLTSFSQRNKKHLKERILMIKKKSTRNIKLLIISTLLLSFVSALPVFAYEVPSTTIQPDYMGEDGSVDWAEFIPDGELIPEDEFAFRETDSYFLTEDGQVILEQPSTSTYKTCSHNYVNGTYKNHKKNTSGGCTVKTYTCMQCTKCGVRKNVSLQNTSTYTKCPH